MWEGWGGATWEGVWGRGHVGRRGGGVKGKGWGRGHVGRQ